MKVIRTPGMPEALFRAVSFDGYVRSGDASVTEILKSPRQFWLTRRHDNEIVVRDVDRLWSMYGTMIHNILEHSAGQDVLTEEKLAITIEGWKVTGRPDHYDGSILSDYKFTSVWSLILGVRPEWSEQLNMYAEMFRRQGFPVNAIQNVMLFRDWQRSRAGRDEGYPRFPVQVYTHPMDETPVVLERMCHRVKTIQRAEIYEDAALPPCSEADRWFRPGKWAIMKKGRKSAIKLCDSQAEAEALLDAKGGTHIEDRPGKNAKCEMCDVRQFCNQADELGVPAKELCDADADA